MYTVIYNLTEIILFSICLCLTARIQYTYEGALWIGASDLSAEGGFEWSDGAPFRYINWNAGILCRVPNMQMKIVMFFSL